MNQFQREVIDQIRKGIDRARHEGVMVEYPRGAMIAGEWVAWPCDPPPRESGAPYRDLWLSPSADKPLVFGLWQFRSDGNGSDELNVQLDLQHGLLDALAGPEPIFERQTLQAWSSALRELATKMEKAIEAGHYVDEPLPVQPLTTLAVSATLRGR